MYKICFPIQNITLCIIDIPVLNILSIIVLLGIGGNIVLRAYLHKYIQAIVTQAIASLDTSPEEHCD